MNANSTLKVLMFINYFGKASETFISDEIDFLSRQASIELDILHYGKSLPENNIYGLNLPSSIVNRLLSSPSKFSYSFLKSLKYRNGRNGSLGHLINFFKNRHYDTIYCHFGTNGKLIAQLKELNVISNKTRLVIRFHGLDITLSKYPVGYYDILNKQGRTFLVGSNYASDLLRTYKLDERKIEMLPVGLKKENIGLKVSQSRFQDICKILSIGRLIELKGHHVAIKIFATLKTNGIRFSYRIIGSGAMEQQLKQMIIDNDLTTEVEIVPELSHQEVLNEIKDHDIYLYAGIYDKENRVEAQGLANIEAMANGMIIVASNLGGVPDYVVEGKTGFLCEPENIEEFVKKLQWIMDNYNSDKIVELRKNAIELVSQNYCQESLNQKLLSVLIEEKNER